MFNGPFNRMESISDIVFDKRRYVFLRFINQIYQWFNGDIICVQIQNILSQIFIVIFNNLGNV